jgi:hypothetical protein
MLPSFREFFQIFFTFGLTVLGWIFFRAENVHHAFSYLSGIFNSSLFSIPHIPLINDLYILQTVFLICLFLLIEWIGREGKYAIEEIPFFWKRKKIFRWTLYLLIGLAIFTFGNFNKTEFIYFAF